MSVGEMSAVLRTRILEAVEKSILGDRSIITDKLVAKHSEFSSTKEIRKETDAMAESVMSRGSLENLKTDMLNSLKSIEHASLTEEIIRNLSFDGFKDFVLNKYYSKDLKASRSRDDPDFEYTVPTKEVGTRKGTRVILGTHKGSGDGERDASKDVLIFKKIDYNKIVRYFSEYVSDSITGITEEEKGTLIKYMTSTLFNAGHLSGVFNARLSRGLGVVRNFDTNETLIHGKYDEVLSPMFGNILDLLTQADFLSSNIRNDYKLFLRSEKQLNRKSGTLTFVTEVQLASDNKEVGSLLANAGGSLSKLIATARRDITKFNASADKEIAKHTTSLFKHLEKLRNYLDSRVKELKASEITPKELAEQLERATMTVEMYDELVSLKGSDNLKDHVSKVLLDTIVKSVVAKPSKSVAKATSSKTLTNSKSPKQKVSLGKSKKNTVRLKPPKPSVAKVKKSTPATPDLFSLTNLINAAIADKIQQNMGTGAAKNVLNYRSGRFAESVKVEKLSVSREGMITAFYTYMKNPYATFSLGGAQQYPSTRDPKLLIAKSIRELMLIHVDNRIRSVNV